jgi:predicted N-acetyltransferase YhbS
MYLRNVQWPDDQDALLRHILQVHGPTDCDLLAAWYGTTPRFDPADYFVVENDDGTEIIAHVGVVPRLVQIGQSLLTAGEIAFFGVLDSHQDQGIEPALLDIAHDRMVARGDALGLVLGTPNFYEAWQYEYAVGLYLTSYESDIPTDLALKAGHWDLQHAYERRTADWLGVRSRPLTVRRFYLSDLPAVMALYQAESRAGHSILARDEETWLWQLDYMTRIGRNEPDDFLVVEIENQIAGYIRLVTDTPLNWFREAEAARFSVIEAAGSDPDAIEALLAEAARLAQTFNARRIGLFVHPASQFARHALVRGASFRSFTGAGFMRVHNLPLAVQQLGPELEARRLASPYAGRAFRLVITTEHDQAEIELGHGTPEPVELEVPATAFVRLLSGWYGIDHLNAGYLARHDDLLRVLFPRRDPKIGLADLI